MLNILADLQYILYGIPHTISRIVKKAFVEWWLNFVKTKVGFKYWVFDVHSVVNQTIISFIIFQIQKSNPKVNINSKNQNENVL